MQVNKRIIPTLLIIVLIIFSSCSISRQTTARYQTLSQKAQVTLNWEQKQYSITGLVKVWRNELVAISIQPMLGIEMFRIEATPDSVLIFDKINRRYVAGTYAELQWIVGNKMSYKTIQDFVSRQVKKEKKPLQLSITAGTQQLSLSCTFSNREHNTLQPPRRIKTSNYKLVTLQEILPI